MIVSPEKGHVRLFDLDADPGETTNLAKSEASRVQAMSAGLSVMKDAASEAAPQSTAGEGLELDEDAIDTLRKLGYVEDR